LALALAALAIACEPSTRSTQSRGSSTAATRASKREPKFDMWSNKAEYERGLAALHAMDALRGKLMTEALATDLDLQCADLKAVAAKLAAERDPLVWRLRTDIQKTCTFDVPLACGQLEVQAIQRKRAGDPTASVDRECTALRMAIGDTGAGYLENPAVVDLGASLVRYCGEATVEVRRLP
jgi:hypothetical protein